MWLLLSGALLAAPADAAERRALVVGANDGGAELALLHHAEADALRVADVLTELGGFDGSQVVVLASPTAREVRAALDALARTGTEDGSMFVFYYSGHADAAGLRLGADTLSWEELKAEVRQVPAGVHLGILDACQSGAISRVKGAAVSEPFLGQDDLIAAEGEAWIEAAAADEGAQESDRLEGSFFTHYLVSGLRGAADGGDGRVSLSEAYHYAYDRTVSRTAGTAAGAQHPEYQFKLSGTGELPLTDVRQATAVVVFADEQPGVITVLRRSDGLPMAEVAKPPGKTVRLALPPDTYILRSRVDGRIHEATIGLAAGAEHTVDRWGDARAEIALAKGAAPSPVAAEPPPVGNPFAWDPTELEAQLTQGWVLLKDSLGSVRLRQRTGVAGALSAVVPGAGQAYTGRWGAGLAFLAGTTAFAGGGYTLSLLAADGSVESGALTGPTPLTLFGTALYGWAIADAVHGVHRRPGRPVTGVTLGAETLWTADVGFPHTTGLSVDFVVVPGLSLGLDRLGFLKRPDGVAVVGAGARVGLALEAGRLRPGVYAALGSRTYFEVEPPSDLDWVGTIPGREETWSSTVYAAGAQVRWYTTRRYFVQVEVRGEQEAGVSSLSAGGGLGVHLGGGAADPQVARSQARPRRWVVGPWEGW